MRSLVQMTLRTAGAVTFSLALVACGSSGAKSTTTTTRPNPTPTTSRAAAARGRERACGQITKAYNRAVGHAASAARSPAVLRRSSDANRRQEQAALVDAPNQVKPDLRTLLVASAEFTDALAKVNYDVSRLSANATAPLHTPAVTAASVRLYAFISGDCANIK